jgi:hypothetical protein
LVVNHENFSLEKRTLLVYGQKFETLAAFGDQVEAAVGIFFYYGDYFGGASYFGETLLKGAHHAEDSVLGEAFADHFFVAGFEDVQGQRSTREQDNVERE